MDAVLVAARTIAAGEADLLIAGGVESMARAAFVMPKAEAAFSRETAVHDTTIGWRFVNPAMEAAYGTDSMPQTAQNVAEEHGISREAQDAMALASREKATAAQASGRLAAEIVPVAVSQRRGEAVTVEHDGHPRATSLEALARLRPLFPAGSVTAGNSPGASSRPLPACWAGPRRAFRPRVMGIGPAPAEQRLLARLGLSAAEFDVIELNEAFEAQGLATLRLLGIAEHDPRVNPNGGAISLGHPLGMSGARITGTAALVLLRGGGRRSLSTM